MATFVGTNQSVSGSPGTRTLTYNAAVQPGDIAFVYVITDPDGAVGVSDTLGGNTYTTAKLTTTLLSDGTATYWAYSIITTARTSTNTITVTNLQTTQNVITIYIFRPDTGEVFGVPTVAALQNTVSSSTYSASGGAFNIGSIAIGAVSVASATATFTADSDTVGGTWSAQQQSGTSGNRTLRQYKIITAPGSQTYNPTSGTSTSHTTALFYIPTIEVGSASGSSTSSASANIRSTLSPLTEVSLYDNFENVFTGNPSVMDNWVAVGTGATLTRSSTQKYSGSFSAYKAGAAEPNGAYKLLKTPVRRNWTLSAWIYSESGRASLNDRIGIFNSSGNGYGFLVTPTSIGIDRRVGYSPTTLISKSHTRTDNAWYKVEFISNSNNTFTLNVSNAAGVLINTLTSSVDTTYTGPFDRVAILGGVGYYVDELEVMLGVPSTSVNSSISSSLELTLTLIGDNSTSVGSFENLTLLIDSGLLDGSSDSTNSSLDAINDLRLQGSGSSNTDATIVPVVDYRPIIEGSSDSTSPSYSIAVDWYPILTGDDSVSTGSSITPAVEYSPEAFGSSISDADILVRTTYFPYAFGSSTTENVPDVPVLVEYYPIISGTADSTSPSYSMIVAWYPIMETDEDSSSGASYGGIRAVIGPEMFGGSVSNASLVPFFTYYPIATGGSDSTNTPDFVPSLQLYPRATGLSLSVFSPDVTPSVTYAPEAEGSSTSDGSHEIDPMGTMTANKFIGWGIPA